MEKLSKQQVNEIYEKLKTEKDLNEIRRLKYILNVQYGKFGNKEINK